MTTSPLLQSMRRQIQACKSDKSKSAEIQKKYEEFKKECKFNRVLCRYIYNRTLIPDMTPDNLIPQNIRLWVLTPDKKDYMRGLEWKADGLLKKLDRQGYLSEEEDEELHIIDIIRESYNCYRKRSNV